MYRCSECDEFDVVQPMSASTTTHQCPACGKSARRVFTAPALSTTSGAVTRATDIAAASSEAPQVVRSIPSGTTPPRNPRWSPFTGASPVPAKRRTPGPYQPLPKL
ncbi:FmdB family zinc ribbon protein [Nesterenkonia sphaerica]